jgi:twitching motility protein PilT
VARLDYILRAVAAEDSDGLRLRPGHPPELIFGDTAGPMQLPAFSDRQMREFVRELTTQGDLAQLHRDGQIELHYEYGGQFYSCTIRAGSAGFQVEFRPQPTESVSESMREAAVSRGDVTGHYAITEDGTAVPLAQVEVVGVDDVSDTVSPEFEPLPANDRLLEEVGSEPGFLEELIEREQEEEARASGPRMEMDAEEPPGRPPLRPGISIHYTRDEATAPPRFGQKLSRQEFEKLLRWMVEQEATDLHITPRFPPTLRVDNLFQPSKARSLGREEIEHVILSILGHNERSILKAEQAVDLSYEVEGLGRFRINVFRQLHGLSAAVRYVRSAIDSLEELKLPAELNWLTNQQTGLVLFTGPTGSGKSTTMAALIEQMNMSRQLHILTLEAPIEYLFANQRCLIQQREVGTHTDSFGRGLKDALRENPDVIMVGELRDYETVSMAISAAETGHLIMATLHANTTNNAVSRLIDVFPDNQKSGARAMIADSLTAVVNLRLLTHQSGRGLVPAVEFLKNNHAVSSTIRDNKLHQIRQVLSTSIGDGMWPFERNLADLVRRNEVDYETAYRAAPDKKVFEGILQTAKKRRKKR